MQLVVILLFLTLMGETMFITKLRDQHFKDRRRKTYRLSFPRDLNEDRVLEWVRSLTGSLRTDSFLSGSPTVVFETWATSAGIIHRLKIPYGEEGFIIPQLRLAGVRVDSETEFPQRQWTRAVEIGLRHNHRTLQIDSIPAMSGRMLKAVESLHENETVLVQWVMTPAIPPSSMPEHDKTPSAEFHLEHLSKGNVASRDEINDRRKKLEEQNMHAVLRVAAFASSESRADNLIHPVRSALGSIRKGKTRFEKRFVRKQTLQNRIDNASASIFFPIRLSASEVAALIGWNVGDQFVAGISHALSRHLPPSVLIPAVGRVLGTANMPGAERDIATSYMSATRHTHVIGRTGVGKTTLLANMMTQDMENGNGVILIEGKGDLFEAALARIPDNRLDDVIILDVNDTARPVGFNILDQGNSRTAIDELCTLIANLYKDTSQSIRAPQVLYNMTHALAEVPGSTFVDLPTLLTPADSGTPEGIWRDYIGRQVKDPEVSLFLQRYLNLTPKQQDDVSAPVFNRIWQFTSRPEIKHILGQRQSSFQMTDVIRDNKILLVNLNGIRVGQQTAGLAGTLLVNAVWQAVRSVTTNKPNFLYLDEFQDFTNLPVDLESMLAKARSSKLGAVLAHQNLSQLRPEIRSGVMANTATKIVFRISSDDARLMARELSRYVDDTDFTSLPEHEAVAMVATDTGSAPPVSISTKPPSASSRNGTKARNISRMRYGRPIKDVERELTEHKAPAAKKKSRPKISDFDWGN
jgi:hypothetical protein